MAAISTATYLAVASALVGAYGVYAQGQAQKTAGAAANTAALARAAAADREAEAMEQRAGQERASAQRGALEQKRRASIVGSAAKARAAASGAALDSPDIANIMADIEQGGEYEALTALYEGEESAKGLEHGAAITRAGAQGERYSGQVALNAGRSAAGRSYVGAAGSLLEGAARAYRYESGFRADEIDRRRRGASGPYYDYG